jgi:hypothetical protein
MAMRQPTITLTVNKELLEDVEQCARKSGMNVNRFVSEMVESALAERRLDIQERRQPPFLRNASRSEA